jgi:S-adenosylmethionine/arginine decarboxylase-like enzyme
MNYRRSKHAMSHYWGYHLMLDCSGCDNASITSRENIYNFTKELVKRIDMVAYGEPVIEHFATHDPLKAGFSMVQLIETSNISMHAVDKDNTMYLDVFSCKPFSNEDVIATVKEYFKSGMERINYVTRHA